MTYEIQQNTIIDGWVPFIFDEVGEYIKPDPNGEPVNYSTREEAQRAIDEFNWAEDFPRYLPEEFRVVVIRPDNLRVVSVETEHTGGGVIATLHTLSDGRILIGSNTDETIQIAENLKAWQSGDYDEDVAYIDITTALWKLGI